jgi:hypothetical protein
MTMTQELIVRYLRCTPSAQRIYDLLMLRLGVSTWIDFDLDCE